MAQTTFTISDDHKFEAAERARVNGVDGVVWVERRKCADGSGWMHWGRRHLPLRATRRDVVEAFGCTMPPPTARLRLRDSCAGTVHIARLVASNGQTLYETRAWGTAQNAADDARSRAAELGLTLLDA